MLLAPTSPRSLTLAIASLLLCSPFVGCGGDEFSSAGQGGAAATGGAAPADASTDPSAAGASGKSGAGGGAAGGTQDAAAGAAGEAGAAGASGASGAAGAAGVSGQGGSGGATTDACVPETAQDLCGSHQAICGPISGKDKCGTAYTHFCGDCACGLSCTPDNKCGATPCEFGIGQSGCSCNAQCCGGICAGGSCCVDNGNSCGTGPECGENTNCCSGKCNNGQCWGAELTCTP
ncbi:MAG TPA: hypothetical protein PLI95_09930 [Polyangiaceae bacterium]|nr:hypothetical protein [Polyangiaceae bacterium]